MASATAPISDELGLVCELIAGCQTIHGIVIPLEKTEPLMKRLHVLRLQAASMEHELGAHRIGRANAAAAGAIEDLATDVMADGLLDGHDNIVRPKFGRTT